MLARLLAASALLISVQLSVARTAAANTNQTQGSPGSLAELRKPLDTILQKTRTPAASVGIVRRDGPEWIAGLGMADIAAGREASADTLFRIGSTSKAVPSP